MNEPNLSVLIREHVAHDEPPFTIGASDVISRGRRTLRRRRVAAFGSTGLALVVLAVSASVLVQNRSDESARLGQPIDPLTKVALQQYDAPQMPKLLDRKIGEVLNGSGADFGPGRFEATDSQEQKLPSKYYDKASGMALTYLQSDRSFRVALEHSRSEAEGNARKECAESLKYGDQLRCTVSTNAVGDTITTSVSRVIRDGKWWDAVSPEALRKGSLNGATGEIKLDGDHPLWFMRSVKAVHSRTFLTASTEWVKAPTLEKADQLWKISPADLQKISTDPELVIPHPPIQKNGCAWTLPGTNVSCSKTSH